MSCPSVCIRKTTVHIPLPNISKMVEETYLCTEEPSDVSEMHIYSFLQPTPSSGARLPSQKNAYKYTTVIEVSSEVYAVFFDEKLAYIIKRPNRYFFKDLKERKMASAYLSQKYRLSKTSGELDY